MAQIKVTTASSQEVFVPHIGSVEPNKWVEVNEERLTAFEVAKGFSLSDAPHIEVKMTKTKKKESE